MDVQELRDWIIENNVRTRAIEGFWSSMKIYRTEDPEGFEEVFWNYSQEYLKVDIEDISIHIKNLIDSENRQFEYVEVKVRIEYRKNEIGYYRIIFNLDGTFENDYFISEWTGIRLYQTRGLLEDIKEEIETDYINGVITENDATRIKEIIEIKKEQVRKEFDRIHRTSDNT